MNSTWGFPFTANTFFMNFAREGAGNGFGGFIYLLLEKIRSTITTADERKTIFISTPDGIPQYEKQGCRTIKNSSCSYWVKSKLALEYYAINREETVDDSIMDLNN